MVAFAKPHRKTLTPDRSAKDSGRRYYSPEISRWLNRDPIGEMGGVNLYALVQNDPISRRDRDGRMLATTVGSRTSSDCGNINWRIKWELAASESPGFIVQEVRFARRVWNCSGALMPTPLLWALVPGKTVQVFPAVTFQEAWTVTTPGTITPSAFDTWSPADLRRSAGWLSISAKARFSLGTLAPGFAVGGSPWSGSVPSSTVPPATPYAGVFWWPPATISRSVYHSWNCCRCWYNPLSWTQPPGSTTTTWCP